MSATAIAAKKASIARLREMVVSKGFSRADRASMRRRIDALQDDIREMERDIPDYGQFDGYTISELEGK